ncbi:hypothetical protein JW968_00900 [Candidatus Woesearchaeota archaeon]|nr:hypothetical protein [Candidatus Woesearchaeota archaeon]
MEKIVLDTNFVMIPAEFGIDVFKEIRNCLDCQYKLFIVDKTIKELEKILEKGKGKEKSSAKLALDLIKAKALNIIPMESPEYTDRLLLDLGEKGYIIATQDKELKRKLKEKGAKVLTLRQKRTVIFG